MLELDQLTTAQIADMERINVGIPNDDHWIRIGAELILKEAGAKIEPFLYTMPLDMNHYRWVFAYRAFFDTSTRRVPGPKSPEAKAVLIGELCPSFTILKRTANGDFDFGIVGLHEYHENPMDSIKIADIHTPGLSGLSTIPLVLVSSWMFGEGVPSDYKLGGYSHRDRILHNIVAASSRVADKAARLRAGYPARQELCDRDRNIYG